MLESVKKERIKVLCFLLSLMVFVLNGCAGEYYLTPSGVERYDTKSSSSSKSQDSKSQDSADCAKDRSEEAETGKPMCKEYLPQEGTKTYRWQPFKKK